MSAILPYHVPASEAQTHSPRTPHSTHSAYFSSGFSSARQRFRRFGTLAPIVLLHIGFVYALQSGMAQQAANIPATVFATLIQSEPAHPAPPQSPAKPVQAPTLTVPAIVPATVPDVVTQSIATTPADPAPAAPQPPAAAPVQSAPAMPKTVSGVEYIQPPQPEYPPVSRRLGEQGKVLLRVLVNEKGRAERIELQRSSGFTRLDEAAHAAVARTLFKPYVEDGKAIPVFVVVPVGFQLD